MFLKILSLATAIDFFNVSKKSLHVHEDPVPLNVPQASSEKIGKVPLQHLLYKENEAGAHL